MRPMTTLLVSLVPSVGCCGKTSVRALVEFTGLSLHLREQTYGGEYPLKFDSGGILSVSPGIVLGLDAFPHANENWFLRTTTAFFADTAGLPAGYFHSGAGTSWGATERIRIGLEAGPSVYWRQNWRRESWYDPDKPDYFSDNGPQLETFNVAGTNDRHEIFLVFAWGIEVTWLLDETTGTEWITTIPINLPFVINVFTGWRWTL